MILIRQLWVEAIAFKQNFMFACNSTEFAVWDSMLTLAKLVMWINVVMKICILMWDWTIHWEICRNNTQSRFLLQSELGTSLVLIWPCHLEDMHNLLTPTWLLVLLAQHSILWNVVQVVVIVINGRNWIGTATYCIFNLFLFFGARS